MITSEEVMTAIQQAKKLDLRFLRDMDELLKTEEVVTQARQKDICK